MHTDNHTQSLLKKYILNQCTKAEVEEVITYFQKIKQSNQLPTVEEVLELLDEKPTMAIEDANRIHNNILTTVQKPTNRKRHFWKYVAAASVLIIVSLTIFLNKSSDQPQFTEPIIVNNQIETGTDKATLTLADGTNVALVKGETYQTQNATSNGEQIIYNNSTSRELVNNYLTTARGEQFQITLADGTQVWLNSESQLKYPVSFTDGESRQVELVYGEVYFEVSPSTSHNGADFKVYHKEQEVQVLGTEFNIKAYKDETNIYTTLVEGKVSVATGSNNKVLIPNQQSNLDITTSSLVITTVDIKTEISWINGEFRVQSKNLREIMKTLSRWYNMDVTFANKDLEEVKFVGILRKDQDIVEILNMIKNFGVIKNYEINNKTITLK